ncbi:MAG: YitT family protein [Acutalibacteraceae bacterium]
MERKKKLSAKNLLIDALLYIVGSFSYAASVTLFSAPNHIAPGGVTGVATVINYVFPFLPIGVMILALNLPLLLAARLRLGRGFTVRTLITTLMVSVAVDVTDVLLQPFVFQGDKILTCIFGGVLSGFGLGLIFIRGATTGGTDIVARLLERRFPGMSIGRLILITDAVVVSGAAVVYRDVESALYAALFIFVSTAVIDAIVYGRGGGKMLLIMSTDPKAIARGIMDEMERGVTVLKSVSAYTGEERHVLLCAVSRSEVATLRRLVNRIDPAAFIIISSADEVRGLGFRPSDEDL